MCTAAAASAGSGAAQCHARAGRRSGCNGRPSRRTLSPCWRTDDDDDDDIYVQCAHKCRLPCHGHLPDAQKINSAANGEQACGRAARKGRWRAASARRESAGACMRVRGCVVGRVHFLRPLVEARCACGGGQHRMRRLRGSVPRAGEWGGGGARKGREGKGDRGGREGL